MAGLPLAPGPGLQSLPSGDACLPLWLCGDFIMDGGFGRVNDGIPKVVTAMRARATDTGEEGKNEAARIRKRRTLSRPRRRMRSSRSIFIFMGICAHKCAHKAKSAHITLNNIAVDTYSKRRKSNTVSTQDIEV